MSVVAFFPMLTIPSRAELKASPLQTERLLLVPIDASDGPDVWNAVSNSRAFLQRWLPWVQFATDPAASNHFADACSADWEHGRAVRFIIRERTHKKLLGIVGLETCMHLHQSCELGYWLRRDATGKGFMHEAVQATLEFAFRSMGAHRIRVAAATDNHASLRVIARTGARFEGIAREAEWCDGRWLDHAVFSILVSDPRA